MSMVTLEELQKSTDVVGEAVNDATLSSVLIQKMAPKARKRSKSTAGSKRKGKGHHDDIFPLVLTSATQELFGCCADEDVTKKSPYKLLKKDDIVQDMKTRAAVSDFSPVKQIVLVRLTHCYADHSED
ncbi:hypothetical protein ATANTOWER_018214 [Ataeniobius toweri]|uniref:Uncharacterized protein n=1 Tax=Ataeniobius toweri TaxID=208326 RepID=A0ABU7A7L0_9TELE|nr:hypothetical protein [Ataeniobius toweri]